MDTVAHILNPDHPSILPLTIPSLFKSASILISSPHPIPVLLICNNMHVNLCFINSSFVVPLTVVKLYVQLYNSLLYVFSKRNWLLQLQNNNTKAMSFRLSSVSPPKIKKKKSKSRKIRDLSFFQFAIQSKNPPTLKRRQISLK